MQAKLTEEGSVVTCNQSTRTDAVRGEKEFTSVAPVVVVVVMRIRKVVSLNSLCFFCALAEGPQREMTSKREGGSLDVLCCMQHFI